MDLLKLHLRPVRWCLGFEWRPIFGGRRFCQKLVGLTARGKRRLAFLRFFVLTAEWKLYICSWQQQSARVHVGSIGLKDTGKTQTGFRESRAGLSHYVVRESIIYCSFSMHLWNSGLSGNAFLGSTYFIILSKKKKKRLLLKAWSKFHKHFECFLKNQCFWKFVWPLNNYLIFNFYFQLFLIWTLESKLFEKLFLCVFKNYLSIFYFFLNWN